MSVSLTSTAPTATPSTCSTADFSNFHAVDIACVVGSTPATANNVTSVLKDCCKSASVTPNSNGCGYYCLSIEQSVTDLQKCFQAGGISPSNIFCNGNSTATATATPSASASASAKESAKASGSTTSASASQSTGAAAVVGVPQGVSKMGLGMLGMIVVSALAGALL
jgi:hypothetical protein